jgi:hypothetical protein
LRCRHEEPLLVTVRFDAGGEAPRRLAELLTSLRSRRADMLIYTPLKALKPPSTGTTTNAPLTKAAARLQSQIRLPPNSFGSPKRPAGVFSIIVCPL